MDNDTSALINSVMSDLGAMKLDRAQFESQWNDIVDFVIPRNGGFNRPHKSISRRSDKIFDSTSALALRNFTAATDSMITPHTQIWHRLSVTNPALVDNQNVRAYLDAVVDILFRVRYRWRGGFSPQIGAAYQSLGAFGTGALMIDHQIGQGIRYRHIPLQRFYFAEDDAGIVDKGIVCWSITARQAVKKFGLDKLPQAVKNTVEKNPETKFDFIHCARPRVDFDGSKRDAKNMPIQSIWICCNELVEESGFRTFPFAVGRFYIDNESQYGGSPAEDELADIKMTNEMERTIIRSAQKGVDPPLLLSEDGALEGFDLRAGQLNWGGLDAQGRELVKPLNLGANMQLGIEYAEQKRTAINNGFYNTLFQILVNSGDMTATEVLQRAQEKGMLLAPTMGRVQTELLGPTIERELDICASVPGLLPPMPRELIEAGGEVTIEYDSPLNHAMRASQGTAVMQWLQQVGVVAQFDQRALKVPDGIGIARFLADIGGVPVKLIVPQDVIDQQQQQEAQQAQVNQALLAAPVAAGAAKDLATASATAQAANV